LSFLTEVLDSNRHNSEAFFLIIGTGTEYTKLEGWFSANTPANARLLSAVPKQDYDRLVQCCDVGFIFLDPRFTIPNYPSRLLSYMEYRMPVLMAIDKCTDIGKIAEENGYGTWCENGDLDKFNSLLDKLCANLKLREEMGEKGLQFLMDNYLVEQSIKTILNHF